MLHIINEDKETSANQRLLENRIKMLDNEHQRLNKKIEMANKRKEQFEETKK